jgi:transcription-repair coupling factor (superfamily II helicase)
MMITKNSHLDTLKTWIKEGARDISVASISGSARSFFMAELFVEIERPFIVLLPNAKDASRFYRELSFFLPESYGRNTPGDRGLYDFPAYDISPLSGLSPHRNVINRRLRALYSLVSEKNPIVVTSLEAVLFKILPKDALIKALEYLEPGEDLEREGLLKKLETGGYLRTSLVEEMGDYSVRGGVIDIFPPMYTEPVRLEFWGDRLESIRHFDPETQRSTTHLKEMSLLPASEIIMSDENLKRARSMGRLPFQAEGGGFPGQEAWLKHFYPELDTLFDYFPADGIIIPVNPLNVEAEKERFAVRFQAEVEKYRHEAGERIAPFPEMDGVLLSGEDMSSFLEKTQRISFKELNIGSSEKPSKVIDIKGTSEIEGDMEVRLSGKGKVSMAPLAEKISGWVKMGARVVLVCRTGQQADRLKEILKGYGVLIEEVADNWYRADERKKITICMGRLAKGFAWPEMGLYVVSEDEIFGPKRAGAKKRTQEGGLDWASFGQLKVGDLVVHEDHGVGQYGGLIKMEIEDKVNDFILIDYMDKDRLYIPAYRVSAIQKYVGADETDPKLDRLGGTAWGLTKSKAKKAIREIAKQLVEIYALRKYREGFAFSRPDNYFREFEATFEHEETPDQVKAINDVLADMESDRPMDRLVCGDVGFGKTEVAIRAAFKAVMDGKQVAMLVPTTVLAEQHYVTFRSRMEPYSIDVAVLSRFKTAAEQKEIVAKARSGKVDVLIGTHRLLQRDVGFKDLGLLIIDEEQRFGVKQKEGLKKYRALVDVLALTATPIPRTMHMSLMGVRDLSIIETPPEDRLAIQTYLTPYDESTVRDAIEKELERGGQVFFVHNRVRTIETVADRLRKLVPKARFAVAHGQMHGDDLEETMMKFLKRDIDVLVCTTIIESGLDIPSTNTIIINEADNFGLSQIYQLRGRVGRSSENAYAYLLLSKDSVMTRQAEKRLKALMEFTQLGAGIQLAMHDLKIRGGGNILGFSQTGHIAAIGYELYLKLTEEAIAELKGEEPHEEINPEINVNIPAYIPEPYISDIDVRLNIYRRLSALNEPRDLEIMKEEIRDRFGSLRPEVLNLFSVMETRLAMKKKGISRLDIGSDSLVFTFSNKTHVKPENLIKLAEKRRHRVQFLDGSRLKIRIHKESPGEALLEAKVILKDLS